MTAAERARVREARDADQRRQVEEARGVPAVRPRKPQSAVVRAAEKAHRAQDAKEIVKTLIPDTAAVPSGRCAYCGRPARDADVCRAHADLEEGAA